MKLEDFGQCASCANKGEMCRTCSNFQATDGRWIHSNYALGNVTFTTEPIYIEPYRKEARNEPR